MYFDWASLEEDIRSENGKQSVLSKFPDSVGKDVASCVVKSLAQTLSVSVSNGEPSKLKGSRDVEWTMEVLCYGLSLPLIETDTIKDCVNIYCKWLSALTKPELCVPEVIIDDPNRYAQQILLHLHNVFVPRQDSPVSLGHGNKTAVATFSDLVQRQALYCHRVLREVKSTVENSSKISPETWEVLLKFLLGICDVLLSPPTSRDSIGELLCYRVVEVLFEIWVLASERHFPAPSLWKTFREMSRNWRHHESLVIHWHRTNVALTSKLLKSVYGPDFPPLVTSKAIVCFISLMLIVSSLKVALSQSLILIVMLSVEEEQSLVSDSMSDDCVLQCWFRFLHILSNPVDLSKPSVIGERPEFSIPILLLQ